MLWNAYERDLCDRAIYLGDYAGAVDEVIEQLVEEDRLDPDPEIRYAGEHVYLDDIIRLDLV